jgi:type III pantothenate kinase
MRNLLAIDIGNTNIALGMFRDGNLVQRWRISTQQQRTADEYEVLINHLFGNSEIKPEDVGGVIISSVVPKVLVMLRDSLKKFFDVKPMVLGEDIEAPVKNLYDNPRQVGQDRLVNAVAAFRRYGGPCIVVDFGTAVTFDVVSENGEYLGGIIVPGIEISLDALCERAALLPKIELARPKSLIGKDTVESMRSGILYGYAALTDGLIEKLQEDLKCAVFVVVTGGHAPVIAGYLKRANEVNTDLTLEGLHIIYEGSTR